MPTCAKKSCGRHFPLRIVINGRMRQLNKRKYCLDCSPFGKKNTQKIPESGGRCSDCGGLGAVVRKRGGELCFRCNRKARRRDFKDRCLKYKGGKCERCGYSKCPAALHFHHCNPSGKGFSVGPSLTMSWKRIQVELDKCELVCSNCHSELHFLLWQ